MTTTSKVRANVHRLSSHNLQTIATVLDFFACEVNDVRLNQLFRASVTTSRALDQHAAIRNEPLTDEAAQFMREEELKQEILRTVALRRNVPLSSDD